jgi:hypothetical protein
MHTSCKDSILNVSEKSFPMIGKLQNTTEIKTMNMVVVCSFNGILRFSSASVSLL